MNAVMISGRARRRVGCELIWTSIIVGALCAWIPSADAGLFDAFDGYGTTYDECRDKQTLRFLDDQNTSAKSARLKAIIACNAKWKDARPVIKPSDPFMYSCLITSAATFQKDYRKFVEMMVPFTSGEATSCYEKVEDQRLALYAVCEPRNASSLKGIAHDARVQFSIGPHKVNVPAFGRDSKITGCTVIEAADIGVTVTARMTALKIQTNTGQKVRK